MKLKANREQLQRAFQMAASVAPTRSPKPILQNVLMSIRPGSATIMATDSEVGVRIEIDDVETDDTGRIILNVIRVGAILRECKAETVEITAASGKVAIKAGGSRFNLNSEDEGDFPDVPHMKPGGHFVCAAIPFRVMFKRVSFATDNETRNYAMAGVKIEFSDDTIRAVATDGRRLATMAIPSTMVSSPEIADGTIVPIKAVSLIDKAIGGSEFQVEIMPTLNDIVIRCGNVTISSRLVSGRFPAWQHVVATTDGGVEIEIPLEETYSAIRQAAITTSAERKAVDFVFGNGNLELRSAGEMGTANAVVPIVYDGETIDIALDHRFVSDFFKVLDGETVPVVKLVDADTAAHFSVGDEYVYLVMPMAKGE